MKPTNERADAQINKEIKCLDKGFVRLVDYMGGDDRIVQAARVSYGNGTKTKREDAGLIKYLIEQSHTSPLEKVQLEFHMKMPIFVARQIVRHRVAKINEVSGRYSVMKDECYVPDLEHICYQSVDNKQGRSGPLPENEAEAVQERLISGQNDAFKSYGLLVEASSETAPYGGFGVAKELARINLPLSTYTEWYWTIDLHNLFHFLRLRLDGHAQYEARVYAQALADCAKEVAPVAYAAFEEHILNSAKFSRTEMSLLRQILKTHQTPTDEVLTDMLGKRGVETFKKKLGVQS